MPQLLGITQSAFDPASRVRLIQFMPYLAQAGWHVTHRPNMPDRQWTSPLRSRIARAAHYRIGRMRMKINRWRDIQDAARFDAVFVNRDLAGGGLLFEKRLWNANPRIVYDFDDAIFIGRNEPAVRWMCQHASWVTPGNDYLAEFARRYNDRVTVIPTVIDTEKYLTKSYGSESPDTVVRVGWSGSDLSIGPTLFPYLSMLAGLQAKLNFEFVIISNSKPSLPLSDLRWTFREWRAEEEGRLAETMDIGLMPLRDDEFQRGKCGLKLLQYMAAGLPTIASPVGVNRQITRPSTGFLASTTEEWENALEDLLESPRLRRTMGQEGRRVCEDHYSVRRWLPTLVDILNQVGESRT